MAAFLPFLRLQNVKISGPFCLQKLLHLRHFTLKRCELQQLSSSLGFLAAFFAPGTNLGARETVGEQPWNIFLKLYWGQLQHLQTLDLSASWLVLRLTQDGQKVQCNILAISCRNMYAGYVCIHVYIYIHIYVHFINILHSLVRSFWFWWSMSSMYHYFCDILDSCLLRF